jgi:hypothetical protein
MKKDDLSQEEIRKLANRLGKPAPGEHLSDQETSQLADLIVEKGYLSAIKEMPAFEAHLVQCDQCANALLALIDAIQDVPEFEKAVQFDLSFLKKKTQVWDLVHEKVWEISEKIRITVEGAKLNISTGAPHTWTLATAPATRSGEGTQERSLPGTLAIDLPDQAGLLTALLANTPLGIQLVVQGVKRDPAIEVEPVSGRLRPEDVDYWISPVQLRDCSLEFSGLSSGNYLLEITWQENTYSLPLEIGN